MRGSNELWFATSNGHKFEEASIVLGRFGFALKRLPAKGTELQLDDLEAIATASARETFKKERKPLFVEDTGLFVKSLSGFPGPYASYVNRTIGPRSLITLMKGARSREAEFVSAVAYCHGSGRVYVFTGRLRGRISATARGTNGFGFDPVFVPSGSKSTLGEMSMDEKCAISHRSLALAALGSWLRPRRGK